jgi:hypothetical protein
MSNNWRGSVFRSKRWARGQKQENEARATKAGQNGDSSSTEDKDKERGGDKDKDWGEDVEVPEYLFK